MQEIPEYCKHHAVAESIQALSCCVLPSGHSGSNTEVRDGSQGRHSCISPFPAPVPRAAVEGGKVTWKVTEQKDTAYCI